MATIVAADDHPEILDLIRQALDDHVIHTAADGAAGLALVQRERPDLVILDVGMPVMDGHAVCRAIKGDAAIRHIPVLMLTGQGTMGDVETGAKMGADDYIVKPFSPRVLAGRIKQLLARKA